LIQTPSLPLAVEGVSVWRQSNCWGEKHVSGIRSVFTHRTQANARVRRGPVNAQLGSTDCTLRSDMRGIAKAASLRSPFKGGAPFSRKSLLRSVGLTSRSAWNHASPSMQSVCLPYASCSDARSRLRRAPRVGPFPQRTPNAGIDKTCIVRVK
jgi:hypothetical protein